MFLRVQKTRTWARRWWRWWRERSRCQWLKDNPIFGWNDKLIVNVPQRLPNCLGIEKGLCRWNYASTLKAVLDYCGLLRSVRLLAKVPATWSRPVVPKLFITAARSTLGNYTATGEYPMLFVSFQLLPKWSHIKIQACPWECHSYGKRPMRWDRHKLLWDGMGKTNMWHGQA